MNVALNEESGAFPRTSEGMAFARWLVILVMRDTRELDGVLGDEPLPL